MNPNYTILGNRFLLNVYHVLMKGKQNSVSISICYVSQPINKI